jgi:hypothetical protein
MRLIAVLAFAMMTGCGTQPSQEVKEQPTATLAGAANGGGSTRIADTQDETWTALHSTLQSIHKNENGKLMSSAGEVQAADNVSDWLAQVSQITPDTVICGCGGGWCCCHAGPGKDWCLPAVYV